MKRNVNTLKAFFLFFFLLTLIMPKGYALEKTIKIGFVGDFSDVSQAYTHNMYKAAQLAVNEFNAAGGLLGQRIGLISRDGGNDPRKHYEHVISLVQDEKVVAIFGGASSLCVLKASEASKEQRVPYLVSIGNSQLIVVEKGHPYVFLFEPNNWMETRGFSIFVTLMPWKHYAWVGPDYLWGRDVLRNFKQHFKEIGATIEWTTEAWHPLGATDYETIIRQILDGKPDALVIGSWGEDVRQFILQAKPHGLFDKMAIFGWFTYDIGGETGRLLPEGMWSLSRGPFNYLADKYPQAKDFVDKFAKQFDAYPNGFTVCCYDSFIAWRQAVKKTQSADPAAVAKALKSLEFVGLRGSSAIRAVDGQMNCPAYFGRLVFVPEYPFAVWKSVIEVPAVKTWLPEKEVVSRRKKPRS